MHDFFLGWVEGLMFHVSCVNPCLIYSTGCLPKLFGKGGSRWAPTGWEGKIINVKK